MENKTVKELKQIAKERRIKYYYKLKKEDLVRALQPQRSILSWVRSVVAPQPVQRPVPAPRPIPAPRPVAQRPVPAPRPVSNELISFGPARLENRETAPRPSMMDEPFQDTTEIITPKPVPAPRPSLFSRFKTSAINAVNHGFNRVLEAIDPYVPTPVKNTVRNVKRGVGQTIKALKEIAFTPIPAPRPAPRPVARPRRARPVPAPRPIVFKLTNHAVKNVAKQYSYEAAGGQQDVSAFLERVREAALKVLRENKNKKVWFALKCEMSRPIILTGEELIEVATFTCKSKIVLEATHLGELYDVNVERILENIVNFNTNGSNWRVSSILRMDINMINYNPLSASSWIELDEFIVKKNAVINMKNKDDECFKWCVTRALNMKVRDNERIDKELIKQSKELNWEGIEFPFKLSQIAKFEKNNPDISIAVFCFENKKPIPLNQIKNDGRKHHIDLLLVSDQVTSHYCLIKNFSRLMNSSKSKDEHKKYYCRNCMLGYRSKEALSKHWPYCKEHGCVRVELPKKDTFLKFSHPERKMRVPFVIYADFESYIKPICTCDPDEKKSFTKKYQKHTPSSFCYYIKCFDENVYEGKLVTYTAESETDDVAGKFVESIGKDVIDIYERTKSPKKIEMTDEDEKNYKNAKDCHICEKELEGDKVKDHCHLTGKYRGAAHNNCNTKYRVPKFIPIVFHNLAGYDCHLFIKKLASSIPGDLKCIPSNEEKYISFSKEIKVGEFIGKDGKPHDVKRELRFIDSYKFMGSSLKDLTDNLVKDLCHECSRLDAKTCKADCLDRKGDKCKCKANCKECENRKFKKGDEMCKNLNYIYTGEKRDLLLRKGVYPYDWVDSIDKFSETQLPPIDSFYSKLNDEGISNEDYLHAEKVWKVFNCQTFRDYHNIYNVSDVLILADVFENFRDVCSENYGIDPAHHFTSPGLAWDAALKKTKIELELISDYDMLLMSQKGIRGGISMISNRYGVANNVYMNEMYDPSKESTYIQYLDANNLYGWAMSKPLPTHGFEWMSESDLENWEYIPCLLEVDLDYPESLHDDHSDYPLAPERMLIGKVEKLVPNLKNKKNYVVHYENLKMYISQGLKITKIHRGIKFEERPWLKEYIDLNTNLRTKAKNEFEKDFFKLMNNSVFGKTMENIEKRVNVKLVTTKEKAMKLSSHPNFESFTIFDEHLIAVHMKREKMYYNKPIYLGMCILDLSKTLMYDFVYNYIKPMYGPRAKLLMTDTDSLIYEIKTDDFYKDIYEDVESKFDTSEFDKDHPAIKDFGFKVGKNKKVIGMFKDETGGKQIIEFIGLRSKLYSYRLHEKEHKRCKGVKKSVVAKTITHEDYKNCLLSKKEQLRKMNVIRSHDHNIYTEQINKVALSADDDKRIILADGMQTLAIGHYKCPMGF